MRLPRSSFGRDIGACQQMPGVVPVHFLLCLRSNSP